MVKKKKTTKAKTISKKHGVEVEVEPDGNSTEYFHDEVDQYHMEKDKLMLSEGAQIRGRDNNLYRDEEVLGVASDSSDDDERIEMYESRLKKLRGNVNIDGLGSDLEEEEEKETDDVLLKKNNNEEDDDFSGLEELDDSHLEEKEAIKLQKQLMSEIDEDDFGLVALQKAQRDKVIEKVSRKIENLKKSEKLKILADESPELMLLLKELQLRMKWVEKMIENEKNISSLEKLETKMCLDYCVTLNFYLYLKLKREDITNHPVIERIRFYNEAFKSIDAGKSIKYLKASVIEDSFMINEKIEEKDNEIDENEDNDGRRAINKTIEKNRGLTPRRKKENKNPRVKHRLKFQKALKRRTGQIKPFRKEITPYQGEISGIRSGIKKGIKFK